MVEREVTVTLTSERRRPTHSGTGDGAGRGVAMEDYKGTGNRSPCSHFLGVFRLSGGKISWNHVIKSRNKTGISVLKPLIMRFVDSLSLCRFLFSQRVVEATVSEDVT